jgi:hypothetical protein
VIAVTIAAAAMTGLRRLSDRRRLGALARPGRDAHRSRAKIALVLLVVGAQVARNWLVLRGIGVTVSPFDAIALLITMFTLGQLPIGPSLGAASVVLILGTHGVATAAAAGVLLTATATIGSLCYADWAAGDGLIAHRPPRRDEGALAPSLP